MQHPVADQTNGRTPANRSTNHYVNGAAQPRDQGPTDARPEALAQSPEKARAFAQSHAAAVLADLGRKNYPSLPAAVFLKHRNSLVEQCGAPEDPLLNMMVEQLSWIHLRLGDLHVQAGRADSAEMVTVLNSAAARLSAEFRRGLLAIRTYRSPVPTPQPLTLVQQQNVALGRGQQVEVIEGATAAPISPENSRDIELVSNPQHLTYDDREPLIAQPIKSARGAAEPGEARGVDRGRSRAASRVRVEAPPLAACDGTENGSR
jgi:hypothetical protein